MHLTGKNQVSKAKGVIDMSLSLPRITFRLRLLRFLF